MRSFRQLTLGIAAASALVATPALAQTAAAPARSAAASAATATTYQIDPVHSELSFRIRHLLGRVAGTFGEWNGTIVMDTVTPANSKVDVTVRTASIDTRVKQRDDHLRSPDFFAADSFPTISFRSTKVVKQGKALKVYGDLTIRGRTKPVVLAGAYNGQFKDAYGATRTAFTASTTVNRNDFGVAWNKAVETGAMLGDDVTIDIAVEAVQQQAKP